MEIIHTRILESPLGKITAGATNSGICLLEFDEPERLEKQLSVLRKQYDIQVENTPHPLLDQLESELNEYFRKERTTFTLPLTFVGTPFQQKVWEALLSIPFGSTRSYLEQSKAAGDVNAIRAVASANGQNRISILVPCHRVIGSNGSLTGYGGKLWRKKFLLELESNQQSLF